MIEEGSVIYPEVAIPGEIAMGWRPFPDLDSVFFRDVKSNTGKWIKVI